MHEQAKNSPDASSTSVISDLPIANGTGALRQKPSETPNAANVIDAFLLMRFVSTFQSRRRTPRPPPQPPSLKGLNFRSFYHFPTARTTKPRVADQTATVKLTLSTRRPGLFFRGTEPDTSGTLAQRLCGLWLVGGYRWIMQFGNACWRSFHQRSWPTPSALTSPVMRPPHYSRTLRMVGQLAW
jgi:hypothetical protein